MPSVYSIDGGDVNDREDWRQQFVPGVQPRSIEGFPGDGNLYVIKAPTHPPGVVITGWLQADNVAGLHTQMRTYSNMQGDTEPHEIEIHGSTFGNVDLLAFEVIDGRSTAFQRGFDVWVRQQVRFIWQRITAD